MPPSSNSGPRPQPPPWSLHAHGGHGVCPVNKAEFQGHAEGRASQRAYRHDCRTCCKGFPLPSCTKWQEEEFIPGSTLLNLLISGSGLCQSPHVDSRGQLCGINLSFHVYVDSCDRTQVTRLGWQSPLPTEPYWLDPVAGSS